MYFFHFWVFPILAYIWHQAELVSTATFFPHFLKNNHMKYELQHTWLLGISFFKRDGSCCLSPSDQIPQVILTKHQVGKCQNRFHYRLSRSALSMAHHEIKTRTEFSHVGSTEEDAACINEVCSIFVIIEDPPRFSFYLNKSAQFFSPLWPDLTSYLQSLKRKLYFSVTVPSRL